MARIIAIAALTPKGGISKDGKLIYHNSEDLKLFKRLTTGHKVLFGRKTFDEIGQPLPNRENIVLTRDKSWKHEGVTVFNDIQSLLRSLKDEDVLFVAGGGEIYAQMKPFVKEYCLSVFKKDAEADMFFPQWYGYDFREIHSDSYSDFAFYHYMRKSTYTQNRINNKLPFLNY